MFEMQVDSAIHNPLLNPIPHNIQNPYLSKNSSQAASSGANNFRSSLRSVGNQVV
jgi:hypothetical protein